MELFLIKPLPLKLKYCLTLHSPYIKLKLLMKGLETDHSINDKEKSLKEERLNAFSSFLKNYRILAYASEVGESFRPLIPRSFVRGFYGISWGYVIIDTLFNTMLASEFGYDAAKYTCIDKSIFHTFASMAFPAYTIHSIVRYSGRLLRFLFRGTKLARFGPVGLGLFSIPYIIHPLDHFTEYLMDISIRKFYSHKLPTNLGTPH